MAYFRRAVLGSYPQGAGYVPQSCQSLIPLIKSKIILYSLKVANLENVLYKQIVLISEIDELTGKIK